MSLSIHPLIDNIFSNNIIDDTKSGNILLTLSEHFSQFVSRELKKSKQLYYRNYFEENKMNIKNIWPGIREIVNIRNSKPHKISQLKVSKKLINNTKDISNKLNEHFVNVGPTTEDSIPKTQNVCLKLYERKTELGVLIAYVSQEEVLDIIKSLENKSAGPVSIPINL